MVNTNISSAKLVFLFISIAATAPGCPEEGSAGDDGDIDCGEHGSLHDGHCHCDPGYLFDGETCVTPEEITAICTEHENHAEDAGSQEATHGACHCPDTGDCPCEGTIEEHGGQQYCIPAMHE